MPELRLRDALEDADPAAELTDDALAPSDDVLARILAQPGPHRAPRPRAARRVARLAATAAVVAASALAAPLLAPGDGRDSRAVAALMDAAGTADDARSGSAAVRYSLVETAQVHTYGDPPPFSVHVRRRSALWARPDGSGRVVSVYAKPSFPGPRDRARWIADGRRPLGGGSKRTVESVPPGGLDGPADAGLPPTRELPTEPSALRARLEDAAAETDVPVPVKTFELAAAILAQANPPEELRGSLYRVLAELDGVEYDGEARDPRGRRGVAVSIESDYSGALTRQVLYFEPATSQPLAATEELQSPVQWIDGRTIGYAVVLAEQEVEAVGERPPRR